MALRRSAVCAFERYGADTFRLQRHLAALGDDGACDLIKRHETRRTKRLMATGGALPLVRSASEGVEKTPLLHRARDPLAVGTQCHALPENTVTLYVDCLPNNTILTFLRWKAVQELYEQPAAPAMDTAFGFAAEGTLGTDDIPGEGRQRTSDEGGLVQSLRQQVAPDDHVLTFTPKDSGYPSDACGGYAAAQMATNDAIYSAYQRCLDLGIIAPRTQIFLQVLVRGYHRGRGGVFHALKENPHLARLVDVRDCTDTLSRYQRNKLYERDNRAKDA
eukprot:TRINITY_DN22560_c0_g1_i1.p2 TRINITY_DN22560_c0_g1~~TRINITY_DN22560_c0_g1_i1.p2  ORF type:complete len:276 (+),score=30.25 TRINITY_DN22560_c0_g1_i1:92-919(+)